MLGFWENPWMQILPVSRLLLCAQLIPAMSQVGSRGTCSARFVAGLCLLLRVWVKIKPPGDRRFESTFPLAGFHFRYLFLTHSLPCSTARVVFLWNRATCDQAFHEAAHSGALAGFSRVFNLPMSWFCDFKVLMCLPILASRAF